LVLFLKYIILNKCILMNILKIYFLIKMFSLTNYYHRKWKIISSNLRIVFPEYKF